MSTDPNLACLTCRKRQVKCDGTRPVCVRCPKDGLECRGFKGQMRIVQVNPSKTPAAKKKPRNKTRDQPKANQDCSLRIPNHIIIDNRDMWTLAECAEFWNAEIIPSMFPAERPFFRTTVRLSPDFLVMPRVCLHFVIVTFKSTQAARQLRDPMSVPELCHYRGLGMRELHKYLDTAATDPEGTALVSVIMLMVSDMLLPGGVWLVHLEAVHRILTLRGGVKKCVETSPDALFIVVQFFVVDTLTSTTCSSASLPQRSVSDTLCGVKNVDFHLVTCASACPAEVLQVIAYTSDLRAMGRALSSDNEEDTPTLPSQLQNLVENLDAFDCSAWSIRMSQLGLYYPIMEANVPPCTSVQGLEQVAECFRSAAKIYLLLSCGDMHDADHLATVRQAKSILHDKTERLFEQASTDQNDTLDTQLWKFLNWPLIITAYSTVGWDICADGEDLDTIFERLHLIAVAKGTQLYSDAAVCMREIQERRARNPKLEWTWDMGFPERRAFAL